MIRNMDMGNILGLMEEFMKDFGFMENNMEKGLSQIRRELKLVFGKMGLE